MEFNSVGWHIHRTQEITDCDRWCGLEEVDLRHKGFWHYTPNIRLLGITGEPQKNKEVPIWSKLNEIWMITYSFKGLTISETHPMFMATMCFSSTFILLHQSMTNTHCRFQPIQCWLLALWGSHDLYRHICTSDGLVAWSRTHCKSDTIPSYHNKVNVGMRDDHRDSSASVKGGRNPQRVGSFPAFLSRNDIIIP